MFSSIHHNHLQHAWKITTNAIKIRRFNFIGSLFDTLILSWVMIYQISYVWLDILGKKSDFFQWLQRFSLNALGGEHSVQWIVGLLLVGVFYFFANFIFKNVFNAGLIHLIKSYNDRDEKNYKTMKALVFGWKRSVKLAEYQSLIFWSKPVYIFYIFFYGYRFLDGNIALVIWIAVIFIVILIVTRIFFEYAKYFIIVKNAGVFESISLSMNMALENIEITLKLFFSLLFVYIREIALLIGIFFLPFLLSWIVALELGPLFLQGVFVLVGLVYLLFLIIVSAMNSVIEIFVESLWYSVFIENTGNHAHGGHTDNHDTHSSHH